MKFPYKKIAKDLFRPIIPIEVGGKNIFVKYEVLVDSGADECIFDADIAELLEIDVKRGEEKKVYGVTGAAPEKYYIHPITIKVGGWPIKINVGFLPNLASRYNYGIVGQAGFFENFIVKFDLAKEEVELRQR